MSVITTNISPMSAAAEVLIAVKNADQALSDGDGSIIVPSFGLQHRSYFFCRTLTAFDRAVDGPRLSVDARCFAGKKECFVNRFGKGCARPGAADRDVTVRSARKRIALPIVQRGTGELAAHHRFIA